MNTTTNEYTLWAGDMGFRKPTLLNVYLNNITNPEVPIYVAVIGK